MGIAETSPHLLLGSGPLSDAVSAAMHAVPSGNVYWGDAVAQIPASSELPPDQHDAAMQQHLSGTLLGFAYGPIHVSNEQDRWEDAEMPVAAW